MHGALTKTVAVLAIITSIISILVYFNIKPATSTDDKYNIKIEKVIIYHTCRDPSFGQEGWGREEVVTQSSGWQGGGSNPTNWCNTLKSQIVQGRSIGSNHEATLLNQSEQSKKDWKGHVEYNYHCSIKMKWNPIYKSGTSAVCGILRVEERPLSG